jgi:hypothetical protein
MADALGTQPQGLPAAPDAESALLAKVAAIPDRQQRIVQGTALGLTPMVSADNADLQLVPPSRIAEASKSGYRKGLLMTSPQQNLHVVAHDDAPEAIKNGYTAGQPTPSTAPSANPYTSVTQSIASALPDWAVPALQLAKRIAIDPAERMGAAAAQKFGTAAESAAATAVTNFPQPQLNPNYGKSFSEPKYLPVDLTEQQIQQAREKHPALTGISKGVGEMAGGMVGDPRMWPLLFGGEALPVISKLAGAGFSAQMLYGAYTTYPEIKAAADRGDEEGVYRGLTHLGLSGYMGAKGALHATGVEGPTIGDAKQFAADALRASAERNIARTLDPTTKENKAITEAIAPEIARRGVMALTRGALEKKAAAAAEVAGQKIDDFYQNQVPPGATIPTQPLIDHFEAGKRAFMGSNGEVIDQTAIDRIENLKQVVQQFGPDVSVDDLVKLRRVWDEQIRASKGFFGKTVEEGSLLGAKKAAADSIRKILAEQYPDLDALNKEYSFWANVRDVMGETNLRKAAQRTPLGETIAGSALGTAGYLAHGLQGGEAGLAVATLIKAMRSTGWRTTTSATKYKIADWLAAGDVPSAARIAAQATATTPASAPMTQQEIPFHGGPLFGIEQTPAPEPVRPPYPMPASPLVDQPQAPIEGEYMPEPVPPQQRALPPGPSPLGIARRLQAIGLPEQAAPPSTNVEAVGRPATAEAQNLQQHFERRGPVPAFGVARRLRGQVAAPAPETPTLEPNAPRAGAAAAAGAELEARPLVQPPPEDRQQAFPGMEDLARTAQDFYLKSRQVVEQKLPNSGPGDSMLATLRNSGVKTEEISDLGLDKFLAGKPKVLKQDLINYIDAHTPRLEQTELGGEGGGEGETKYEDYQLGEGGAGGTNYRETLTHLPEHPDLAMLRDLKAQRQQAYTEQNNLVHDINRYRATGPIDLSEWVHGNGARKAEILSQVSSEDAAKLKRIDYLGEVMGRLDPQLEKLEQSTRNDESFKGGHWVNEAPNVQFHSRSSDRVTSDGKNVLLMDENQSDLHQLGREEGYKQDLDKMLTPEERELQALNAKTWRNVQLTEAEKTRQKELEMKGVSDSLRQKAQQAQTGKAPDVPFKKSWWELNFKDRIREAMKNNQAGVAWPYGEAQAARYDLSKQVDRIEYNPDDGYLSAYDDNGSRVIHERTDPEDFHKVIGEEPAKKLQRKVDNYFPYEQRDYSIESDPDEEGSYRVTDENGEVLDEGLTRRQAEGAVDNYHQNDQENSDQETPSISGVDLQIGGEGMNTFYDKMMVEYANKYAKKWGAKVTDTKVSTGAMHHDYAPEVSFEGPPRTAEEVGQAIDELKSPILLAQLHDVLNDMNRGIPYEDAMSGTSDGLAEEMGGKLVRTPRPQYETVHYLEFTPEMQRAIRSEGQPLYSQKLGAGEVSANDKSLARVVKLAAAMNTDLNPGGGDFAAHINLDKNARDLLTALGSGKEWGGINLQASTLDQRPALYRRLADSLEPASPAAAENLRKFADQIEQVIKANVGEPGAGHAGVPLVYNPATLAHEAAIHGGQRALDPEGSIAAFTNIEKTLDHPAVAIAKPVLVANGVPDNPAHIAAEMQAYIHDGDYGALGLTREQAVDFMKHSYDVLAEHHGAEKVADPPRLARRYVQALRDFTGEQNVGQPNQSDQAQAPAAEAQRRGAGENAGANARPGGPPEGRGAQADRANGAQEAQAVASSPFGAVPRIKPKAVSGTPAEIATQNPQFKEWFGDSKVVDEQGQPKVAYRGDYRGERIGAKLKVSRATSGRFYFTEDPEIASKYAEKTDVRHTEEKQNFENWWTFPDKKYKGERTAPDLERVWQRLSPEEKARVQHTVENTSTNEEDGSFKFNAGESIYPNADLPRLLREQRGNWLGVAKDIWLNSGNLHGYEKDFTELLEHAGLKPVYDNPHDPASTVTPVYLNIRNPLDTANLPPNVIDALRTMAKSDRSRPAKYGVDFWDKTTITPKEWMTALEEDLQSGSTHAWTRMPEKVTKLLQSMGYDGVKDTGGKLGGAAHPVWIAFEPNQVKSAIANRGTFSPQSANILESRPLEDRISQRRPTAVNAKENSLTDDLKINTQAIRDAGADTTVANAVRQYPGIKPTGKQPSEIMAGFQKHAADNLAFLHDQVPENFRAQAKQWYDSANRMVGQWSKQDNIAKPQAAAVIASLSPQKDWHMNVSLARRVIDAYQHNQDSGFSPAMSEVARQLAARVPSLKGPLSEIAGKKLSDLATPDQKAMWIRLFDEAHNPRSYDVYAPGGNRIDLARNQNGEPTKVAWGSNAMTAKAISILENGSRENIDTQLGNFHKIRNFYNNIIAPNSKAGDVTVDTHAVAAALLRPLAGGDPEVLHNFGTTGKGTAGAGKSSVTGVIGSYGLYADAYRAAAKRLGVLPRELQSITWEAVRSLFTPEFKTEKNKAIIDDIWRQYSDGKITLGQARKQVLKAAGGFSPPEWSAGLRPGVNEAQRAAAGSQDVPRPGVYGRSPLGAVRRGRGNAPAAVPALNEGALESRPLMPPPRAIPKFLQTGR